MASEDFKRFTEILARYSKKKDFNPNTDLTEEERQFLWRLLFAPKPNWLMTAKENDDDTEDSD